MHDPLTFAEIAGRGVDAPLAVALVLAVADECEASAGQTRGRALPAAEHICLHATGRISIAWDDEQSDERDEHERVKGLAALLASLIAGERAASGKRHLQAAGGLLVLIARASGTMDLPVPPLHAFLQSLLRFGSADQSALAALYWQSLSQRPARLPNSTEAVTVLPLRAERPMTPAPRDRRVNGSRRSDLRREIRHLELQLFQKTPRRSAEPLGRTRAVVAVLLTAAALAASFMIGVNVIAPGHPTRGSSAIAVPVPQTPAPARPSNSAAPPSNDVRSPAAPTRISQSGVSVTPVLTAAAVGRDVFSPSFAEQGHAILFHSGRVRSSLMRLSLNDSAKPAVATVLEDGATNFHAVRSPDGQWLAYDSDRDGTRAVYVARVDGGDGEKVSGDGYAAVPRWSPDSRTLAFLKAEPVHPHVWNVWIAGLADRSLTRVSHHSVGQAWSASWFPGGTRLAYSIEDRLVIVDLAHGTSRSIPSPVRGHLVRTPAVSPDGRWIVFQVHHDGAWLLDVATGKMHRVLNDTTAEEFAWAPDSRRVVYHTHHGGGWSLWQLALGRPA